MNTQTNTTELLETIEAERATFEARLAELLNHPVRVDVCIWKAKDLMRHVPEWPALKGRTCFTKSAPTSWHTTLFISKSDVAARARGER